MKKLIAVLFAAVFTVAAVAQEATPPVKTKGTTATATEKKEAKTKKKAAKKKAPKKAKDTQAEPGK